MFTLFQASSWMFLWTCRPMLSMFWWRVGSGNSGSLLQPRDMNSKKKKKSADKRFSGVVNVAVREARGDICIEVFCLPELVTSPAVWTGNTWQHRKLTATSRQRTDINIRLDSWKPTGSVEANRFRLVSLLVSAVPLSLNSLVYILSLQSLDVLTWNFINGFSLCFHATLDIWLTWLTWRALWFWEKTKRVFWFSRHRNQYLPIITNVVFSSDISKLPVHNVGGCTNFTAAVRGHRSPPTVGVSRNGSKTGSQINTTLILDCVMVAIVWKSSTATQDYEILRLSWF